MSDESASTRPTRCAACNKPLDSPICCTSCGQMSAVEPEAFNYFELFGLEPGFDLREGDLYRRYLELTRSIHPDVAGRVSDEDRRRSLGLSSELNRAYETLRDPITRAEYLLNQLGGTEPGDRSVPPDLLGEIMSLREEIEEAQAGNDAARLRSLRQQVADRRGAVIERIVDLGRSLREEDVDTQKKLREQLNVVKYWGNLLDRLPPSSPI